MYFTGCSCSLFINTNCSHEAGLQLVSTPLNVTTWLSLYMEGQTSQYSLCIFVAQFTFLYGQLDFLYDQPFTFYIVSWTSYTVHSTFYMINLLYFLYDQLNFFHGQLDHLYD